MTLMCGCFEISCPSDQFIPHGLHRMYELRLPLGLPQNGHAGSAPTSANRCSRVDAINSLTSIPIPLLLLRPIHTLAPRALHRYPARHPRLPIRPALVAMVHAPILLPPVSGVNGFITMQIENFGENQVDPWKRPSLHAPGGQDNLAHLTAGSPPSETQ